MQFFLVRQHGRWGASETGADCGGGKKKKIPACDQRVTALTEKELKLPKETQPRPALLPSPLHTPTHTVFVGCSDNNGSWRSRDRRLQTLTALCYVMNVWLPPSQPSSQHYTNMVLLTSPCALCEQSHVCNNDGKRPVLSRGSCAQK